MSKSHFKQFGYCTHRELEQRLCTCSTYKRSLRSLYLWLTLSVPRCLSWMDGQLPETPLLCSRRRSWTAPQKSRRSATLLQSRIKKCLGKQLAQRFGDMQPLSRDLSWGMNRREGWRNWEGAPELPITSFLHVCLFCRPTERPNQF